MITHLSARVAGFLVAVTASAMAVAGHEALQNKNAKKPSFSLKATPQLAVAPARIVFVAELKDGPDDYEPYYCASVEWDWGDDTHSENTQDCDPYEAGKSQIKRRYSEDHTFQECGNFRVTARLKRGSKVVVSTTTTVDIKGGVRDGIEPCR
jgi:hypothetical protein